MWGNYQDQTESPVSLRAVNHLAPYCVKSVSIRVFVVRIFPHLD